MADDLAAPAKKYVGKMAVLDGGVVNFQQWHRPYLKNQHESYGGQGVDLRPERQVKGSSVPAQVRKHDSDRNKGGG